MIYIILINIVFIIWMYYRYQYIQNDSSTGDINIEELSPSVIGYIDNPNGNIMDWVLAEILVLNKKGYIDIEYERKDIDTYGYLIKKKEDVDLAKLKKHELTSYRLIFSDCVNEITMDKLEENIYRSLGEWHEVRVKGINIKKEIEELVEQQGIRDYKKEKQLKIIRNLYFLVSIIILISIKNTPISQLIVFLVQSLIIFYICQNARCLTEKGKSLYWRIKYYKDTLDNNKILEEKKLIHNILLGTNYINSIALHITSDAREEFINDEIQEKYIKKNLNNLKGFIYVIPLLIIEIISWYLK